jgi:hypothetical protein
VAFTATAPGGYRLDLSTQRIGDLNRFSDLALCDGNASLAAMTFSATPALTSGSLNVNATALSLGNGGRTTSTPFSQTSTGTIFRVSNAVGRIMLSAPPAPTRAATREAACGEEQNGTTTGCTGTAVPRLACTQSAGSTLQRHLHVGAATARWMR